MSIKATFNAIFGAILALLLAVGISVMLLQRNLSSLSQSLEVRNTSQKLADELRHSSDDLTRFARMYVVTGEPRYEQYYWDILAIRNGQKARPERYEDIYWDFVAADGNKPRPDGKTASLQQLMKATGFTEKEFAKLTEAQKNSDALVRTEDIAMHSLKGQFDDGQGGFTRKGPPDQALAIRLMHDRAYQREKAKIMRPIDEFFQLIDARTSAGAESVKWRTMRCLYAVSMILVTILILTGLSFLIIRLKITNPVNAVSQAAQLLSKGDLSVNLPANTATDEVGALSRAFRLLAENMRQSMANISEAANLIGSTSYEMLTMTSQLGTSVAETTTAISQTTTTVEEVRQSVQQSSLRAKDVTDSSQAVVEASRGGKKAVDENTAAIGNISQQMEAITKIIVSLNEQAQAIGGITATVTDLADQSNLLAVNAGIEAANAGEHGKGFAVVAQEIRRLSEQSKQATVDVRKILSDIQKSTATAVLAAEQGNNAVQAGVKQAALAGDSIASMSGKTAKAAQDATQIVAASQQQAVGMEQIAKAMENINQAARTNASSIKQSETVVRNLNAMGERLKQQVSQYKF